MQQDARAAGRVGRREAVAVGGSCKLPWRRLLLATARRCCKHHAAVAATPPGRCCTSCPQGGRRS
jgi:hypothetical protein